MNNSQPTRNELFQYSLLALPLAFAGLPLYIHAPDFYIREWGIGIGTIGIVLLFVRLFDAFQDPLIGYFSDRFNNKRLLIMITGAVLLLFGMAGIFYGPVIDIDVTFWFVLSMIVATTGFSICSINLNQIGGFWHDEPYQRTRIAGWREAFALIGLLLAALLPTLFQNYYGAKPAFIYLFWLFALLLLISIGCFTHFAIQTKSNQTDIQTNGSDFRFLSLFLGDNRLFFLTCFLSQLASSLPAVLVLFFIRDYLDADNLAGLFLFLYFISGVLFISAWIQISKSFGKLNTWLISMLISIATFIWVYTISPGDVIAYGIICVLSGIVLGADLALPPSILADRITVQNSKSIATQYFAALGFIPKLTVSIASGIAFLTLDNVGFKVDAENTESALSGLIIIYGLLPCLIKLIAASVIYFIQKRDGEYYENYERSFANGNLNVS